jgi:hypothetical protein
MFSHIHTCTCLCTCHMQKHTHMHLPFSVTCSHPHMHTYLHINMLTHKCTHTWPSLSHMFPSTHIQTHTHKKLFPPHAQTNTNATPKQLNRQTFTHALSHILIHTFTHVNQAHLLTLTNTHKHRRTHIHAHMHTHTHKHMHVQTLCSHIHMHPTYMLKHKQDHIHLHTHAKTHPHSQTHSSMHHYIWQSIFRKKKPIFSSCTELNSNWIKDINTGLCTPSLHDKHQRICINIEVQERNFETRPLCSKGWEQLLRKGTICSCTLKCQVSEEERLTRQGRPLCQMLIWKRIIDRMYKELKRKSNH